MTAVDPTHAPFPGPAAWPRTAPVPAAVPSLVQSSAPVSGRFATKNTRPFATAGADGYGLSTTVLTCASGLVPAGVPSLCHKTAPPTDAPLTKKYSDPPAT